MRWYWVALFATGCAFQLRGVDVELAEDGGPPMEDLATDDMASPPPDDLTGADLSGVDLAMPPGDLPPAFTVTHVPQHYLTDGTCDLTVATSIDTSALKVDGAAVPAGCTFTTEIVDGTLEVAVLAVRSLTATDITVGGTRPLVVVAGTSIALGKLDASGKLAVPGPGGYGPALGPGAGGNGQHAGSFADSGGGGAGYATVGGLGGVGNNPGQNAASGTAGTTQGTADLRLKAPGGSGGGKISSEGCTVTGGGGGAGGGSIQLTAPTSIAISAGINVGGGGGTGGCLMGNSNQGSGGGGGAGGSIYLESRAINVSGGLYANGGGGGGGGSGDAGGHAGGNGGDGQPSTAQAIKGPKGGTFGGDGGLGGTASAPVKGDDADNGGGGGGSAGRIVVRSHGPATVAIASPTPYLDTSVPP